MAANKLRISNGRLVHLENVRMEDRKEVMEAEVNGERESGVPFPLANVRDGIDVN